MNTLMKKKFNLYPLIDPTENFQAAWQIARSTFAGGEKGEEGQKIIENLSKSCKSPWLASAIIREMLRLYTFVLNRAGLEIYFLE